MLPVCSPAATVDKVSAVNGRGATLQAAQPVYLSTLTERTGLPEGTAREAAVALGSDGLLTVQSSLQEDVVRVLSVTVSGKRVLRDSAPATQEPAPPTSPGVVETWTRVEGPALMLAAARMNADPEGFVTSGSIAAQLGVPESVAADALRALHEDGMSTHGEGTLDGDYDVRRLTPDGRRKVGRWPSDAGQSRADLVAALDRIAAAISDPEEKTLVQNMAEGAKKLPGETFVSVVSAVAGAAMSGLLGGV